MPEAPAIVWLVVWASPCHLVSKETAASVFNMKGIFLPGYTILLNLDKLRSDLVGGQELRPLHLTKTLEEES